MPFQTTTNTNQATSHTIAPATNPITTANIGLGLYIHIPWCIKKCPYCDFNSHTLKDDVNFTAYVDSLICDIKSQAVLAAERPIGSIFIGGGTPSLLPVGEFKRLFAVLADILPLDLQCEITLEANPATLEHAPFEEYLTIGINRLSLGVQSFDDTMLKTLGRIHTAHHAKTAIKQAKQAGFERINADIMYGLPNQTVSLASDDLLTAMDLGVSHVSWYQLTIEPNTSFYRSRPILPTEDELAAIECTGQQILYRHHFNNYEISAWVGQDLPTWHNLNYWRFGDYLAIGAGAHGKVSVDERLLANLHQAQFDAITQTGIYRFSKSRTPKDYMNFDNYPKMINCHRILADELPFEFMMNVLRLKDGVDFEHFRVHTGLDLAVIEPIVSKLQADHLLHKHKIAPTDLGYRYANRLMQAFL